MRSSFRAPPIFAWPNSVGFFEAAREMRHIRKTPALCDFAYGPVILVRVFKRVTTPTESSRQYETLERCALLCKESVNIPNANADGIGDCLWVEAGISEPGFYRCTNLSEHDRFWNRYTYRRSLD